MSLECRDWGLRFRVCGVVDLEFRVWGVGFLKGVGGFRAGIRAFKLLGLGSRV